LPAGLLFARQFSEIRERLVEAWVKSAELRKKLVAYAIAGIRGIGVGGVVAPGLADGVEEGFDLDAAGVPLGRVRTG
jgi:methyl coenzyme M reductase gamma subunit